MLSTGLHFASESTPAYGLLTVLRTADGFGRAAPPLPSRRRNDRLWAAPESCPQLDQRSAAPPPGGFQPGFRRPSATLDRSPSGQRLPAGASEASPRGSRPRAGPTARPRAPIASSSATGRRPLPAARPPACPDCDRGLNSHRVSLRRSPDCFKRIRSRGRKRAAKGSCH